MGIFPLGIKGMEEINNLLLTARQKIHRRLLEPPACLLWSAFQGCLPFYCTDPVSSSWKLQQAYVAMLCKLVLLISCFLRRTISFKIPVKVQIPVHPLLCTFNTNPWRDNLQKQKLKYNIQNSWTPDTGFKLSWTLTSYKFLGKICTIPYYLPSGSQRTAVSSQNHSRETGFEYLADIIVLSWVLHCRVSQPALSFMMMWCMVLSHFKSWRNLFSLVFFNTDLA